MDFEIFRELETAIETKYYVNKEQRTVACVISTRNDFMNKIIKYGFADIFSMFTLDWDANDVVKRSYTGIAKCSPEDEWDELYGKQLAEARAMNARKADINAKIAVFSRKMYKCLDNLNDYGRLKAQKELRHE